MNAGVKLLYWKDFDFQNRREQLNHIKRNNSYLGLFLEQFLKRGNSTGIREDVFNHIFSNLDNIKNDRDYTFHLVSLTSNLELGAEWYDWCIACFNSPNHISYGDHMTALTMALQNNISFSDVKRIYENANGNLISIYENIEKYSDKAIGENDKGEPVYIEDGPGFHVQVTGDAKSTPYNFHDSGVVNIFDNLLSAMCQKEDDKSLVEAQTYFVEYSTKLQAFVAEMTGCTTKFVDEWKKDKEEIERLRALYSIQQRMLTAQTQKNNELSSEIMRLNETIATMERDNMRHAAITQKISELQNLAGKEESKHSGVFSSFFNRN